MTLPWAPFSLLATTEGDGKNVLSWRDNAGYIPIYSSNQYICFKEDVNELFAVVPPSVWYTASTLAAALAAAMTAASESGWTYYADYSAGSNLWTISCNHVFSILWNTGYYRVNDLSDTMGFADDHDDTGSSSYPAENGAQFTNSPYNIVYIERKVAGGAYSQIGSAMWASQSYEDMGVEDGTHYYYQVRGYKSGLYTDYSNEADVWTRLPAPTSTYGYCIDKNTIKILWNDNCVNQDGFKIWRNGDENYSSVGKNVTEFTDTGLTPAMWYHYKVKSYNAGVESDWDWEIQIFTTDPPNAPSQLTGQATATSKVRLNFQDNSSNETAFAIMEYAPGGPWTEVATVGPNVTTYERTGLTQNTAYSYLVKARGWGGDSAYSNQVDVVTMADIAQPTNVVAAALSDTIIEVTFQDNSNLEDFHCIERKPDGGAYAEVVQLVANRTYWKDTGRTKGVKYWYKIRAKQTTGPAYSAYSAEAFATTLSEPADPTGLAISEIQDAWMVLTWVKTSGETGYKIEKSTGGAYSEIAVIGAGLERFKVTGLLPSTAYWFKIRAYNAAGNSGYTAPVTETTLATYAETLFEKLCRDPNAKFKFLGELNPIMEMSGFALTSTMTYTYELEIQERGIDVEAVAENDVVYAEKTSVAEVEATASTFYFDYYGRKIYVHTSDGTDPVNFQMLGKFWLRFTNYSTAAVPTVFNDNMYLCFMPKGSVPNADSEVKPYYEGNYKISAGSVRVINADMPEGFYWDAKFAKYEFRNRKFVLKLGGENFTYADFKEVYTGIIHSVSLGDREMEFGLRDPRAGLERSLPINVFDATAYPNIDTTVMEPRIPFYFGTQPNIVPTCIDTVRKIYKVHDGRIKAVNSCLKNGTGAMVEDTDFFVNYKDGTITLASALGDSDFLLVNIDGEPDSAGALISNGADIFKYMCNNFIGLSDAELNLDSIYETKYWFTTAISVPLYKTMSSDEVFRQLEHTMRAYTFQDEFGRVGIKPATTTAPSNARYVRNHHVFSHTQRKSLDDAYYEVSVYYNVSPKTNYHQWKNQRVETIRRRTRSLKRLEIYTYLPTLAAAQTLLNSVVTELDKSFVDAEVGPILLNVNAGDIIKYSRDRYYSLDGTANDLTLRILSINKSFAGNTVRVGFTGEVVS